MDLVNIVSVIVSVSIGAVVTWCVARRYYQKAGNELRQEASELRRLTALVLHGLEDAGLVKLNKDASGKPIGLIIEMSAKGSGAGSASAKGEVIQRKSQNHGVTEASDVDGAKNSG